MSKEDFIEAMGHVDDRILERYAEAEDRLTAKRPKKLWVRWTAAAAALALIVAGIWFGRKPDIPVYEGAVYSAQEIADLFEIKNIEGIATSAYTKVCVQTTDHLNLLSIPEAEYLPLYQYAASGRNLKTEELQTHIDQFFPKITDALCIELPAYSIEEVTASVFSPAFLRASIRTNSYTVSAIQREFQSTFSIRSANLSEAETISLHGKVVQIDQRQTDSEIIESLSNIRSALFEIFNVSFYDTKVIREYDEYSEYGAQWVTVYFYNESDHYLNAFSRIPKSDYIKLEFDNSPNWEGDLVSSSILHKVEISYLQHRTSAEQAIETFAYAKRIPLEEAEALLYDGYVFGGHSCPLCMAAQEKVDFEGYDYVGLEYVFGVDDATGEPTTGIPFYAFYKQIGTAENGNLIFAKTYVPAIEVSGYKEYFQSQTEKHPN